MMLINESDLTQARAAWGNALIEIARAYEAEGIDDARTVAKTMLDSLYGYTLGAVLFKPTMASGEATFRPTRKGALSYFVGQDADYPLDSGFGIKGWRKVESETVAQFIQGDIAMWMGWVTMLDKDGQVTKVDKSWGYKRDSEGTLRIVLHHSSLPYRA